VSGLADWIQDDLFGDEEPEPEEESVPAPPLPDPSQTRTWVPGMDVEHAEHGRGWVWGSGRGIVTVRFETAETPPGPVRSLQAADPDLTPWRPA
jgi:DNA polymerase-4